MLIHHVCVLRKKEKWPCRGDKMALTMGTIFAIRPKMPEELGPGYQLWTAVTLALSMCVHHLNLFSAFPACSPPSKRHIFLFKVI